MGHATTSTQTLPDNRQTLGCPSVPGKLAQAKKCVRPGFSASRRSKRRFNEPERSRLRAGQISMAGCTNRLKVTMVDTGFREVQTRACPCKSRTHRFTGTEWRLHRKRIQRANSHSTGFIPGRIFPSRRRRIGSAPRFESRRIIVRSSSRRIFCTA